MQDQASNVDVLLTDANGVFHSIKVRTYCVFYEIRLNWCCGCFFVITDYSSGYISVDDDKFRLRTIPNFY